MKHLTIRLGIALAGGMGLAVTLMWLLSSPRDIELPVAYAAEWHVCLSGCPYASIQDAVDAASDGDVIKVAAGTYTGVIARARSDIATTGVVTQMVYVSKTITVQGGYTSTDWTTSDPIANPTTLDAENKGRVIYITGDISPTIEGLRLMGGDAGGGVYVMSATATLVGNTVTANLGRGIYLSYSASTLSGNTVTANGGGLLLSYSPATISGNIIATNTAGSGGGLFLSYSPATLSDNIIATNTAGSGGGLFLGFSPAMLNDNIITANTADGDNGGGLFLTRSRATLSRNTITANTAAYNGGGLNLDYNSVATLSNNIISSNTAGYAGGGLYVNYSGSAMLVNNLVAHNQANSLGSGLYILGSSPRMLHTTIARNGSGDGSGVYVDYPGSVAMTNTILVSQTVGITVTEGGTAALVGTLWGSGAWANGADWGGAGSIVTGTVDVFGDPGFVNPDAGDYHIGSGSAALNGGVNAGVMTDIDNQPRPYQAPDLGADEYWPPGMLKYFYLSIVLKNH